jgi:hypothetical protein
MSDDHEVSLMRMDVAFCARLLAAIEAGLESAPIGVVTTPGTESPKHVKAGPPLPASSLGDFQSPPVVTDRLMLDQPLGPGRG